MSKTAEELMASLNKKYKDTVVIKMSDESVDMTLKRFSSGSLSLDKDLGGGLSYGRMTYILGGESSGKSTLAIISSVNMQKKDNRLVLYIDLEKAFDPDYAKKLGLDLDNMIIARPDSIEEAFDIAITMSQTNQVGVIIFDSVASGDLDKKIEGDSKESVLGIKAKLSSENLPTVMTNISKNDIAFLVINQFREKIGLMFGNPTTDTGGKSWKYYASVVIELSTNSSSRLKSGDDFIGATIKYKISKNKTAPPHKEGSYNLMYGYGIDTFHELVDIATKIGVIKKAGSWYKYNDVNIAQGLDSTKEFLENNPELFNEIKEIVYDELGL